MIRTNWKVVKLLNFPLWTIVVFLLISRETYAVHADFFVSLEGNDSWSGKVSAPNKQHSDGPFATLEQAIKAVREKKRKNNNQAKPIAVLIRGGTYFMNEPILFKGDDGGTQQAVVTYAAYPNERVVFSGGYPIRDWQKKSSGLWEARLPDTGYKEAPWNFKSLFVAGQRAYRAHLPKNGYFYATAKIEPSPEFKEKGFDRLQFKPGDLLNKYYNQEDVEVIVFHRWVNSRLHVKSIDTDKNIVSFDGSTPGASRFYEIVQGTRFRIDNVREAVTNPRDWYFDRNSRALTYKAASEENPAHSEIVASRLPFLFQIKDTESIRLRGLTFSHTHWESSNTTYIENQSADNIGEAALQIQNSSRIQIINCHFSSLDGYALEIGPGSVKNEISDNFFYDLGSGAIKINGSKEAPTSENRIENNLIANGGRLYPTGAGILLKLSDRNLIRNNDIFDFYYTGVSVGWHWGYGDTLAYGNQVLSNKIYKIGQGVMSDLGGVYTLGVSGKTLIQGNVIHDVESFQEHNGWGIYFDEGSQDVIAKNNLVYRIRSGGFHQHYGKNNLVTNNIFAFSRFAQVQRTKDEDHLSFTFTNNIVYWNTDDALFKKNWYGSGYKLDSNIYWNSRSPDIKFPDPATKKDNYSELALSFLDWKKRGQDVHSLMVDPEFVDPREFDFRFKKGSSFHRIGFKPFDYKKAGRKSKHKPTIQMTPPSFETKTVFN